MVTFCNCDSRRNVISYAPMKRWNVLAMISPMSAQRVAGIAQYAKEHSWNLLIMDRLGHHPVVWKGDGVLATIRSDPVVFTHIRKFIDSGLPVVDLTESRPEVDVPRVTSDHTEIGRIAGRHFAERNFRHLAWFSTAWGNVHSMRYAGFAETSPVKPERWVVCEECARSGLSTDWPAFLQWIRNRFRTAPKPLAFLCYDETDAARLLYAASEIGISVPEDVAILSIGNDPLVCENQSVPLSSIDQNLYRGGYEAAAMLDRLMRRKSHARVETIRVPPVGVVTRQSTDVLAVADPEARRVIKFATEHLGEKTGALQISQALGIPRARLDECLRKEFGHSVSTQIRKMRFAKACALLHTTDMTVGEIAAQTGFCHQAHLTNAFRQMFGTTPNVWRKSN